MRYWLWAARPEHYATFAQTGTFGVRQQGRTALQRIRPGDRIVAVVTQGGGLAGLFEAVGAPFEDRTPLLLDKPTPHRIRVRRLAELPPDDWIPLGPLLDDLTVLREYSQFDTPAQRFAAVVRQLVHELPAVDGKVLEFTIHARQAAPLGPILDFVERFVREPDALAPASDAAPAVQEPAAPYRPRLEDFDRAAATEMVIERLGAQGFVYAPWEVAAYLTALRTKPFVLLAGPTGVGKSALPRLVAEATGGAATLIPVRPDWTDAAEVLGYLDLAGRFRPGALLRAARAAQADPTRHHVAVLDEMNLARPEQYLAEVLSRLEDRRPAPRGFATAPLLGLDLDEANASWATVPLPPNLGLVGTVNVDESTHPFSRKVLDRAFVLDLGATALRDWSLAAGGVPDLIAWPAAAWQPRAVRLAGLTGLAADEARAVESVVGALAEADALLRPAGFAVGYRSRDEAALFALHASATPEAFCTSAGASVAPLDVALAAKLLPRLAGGSRAFAAALAALLGWAVEGAAEAGAWLDVYAEAGRPARYPDARYPRTAAHLARMLERLESEGYASFWD